jgi:diadenylate cyclase
VLDILAVAAVIYQLIQIIRGTRAFHILLGILTVVITYEVALRAGLELLRSLLALLAPYTAIAIIVLFQGEIRSTLARLGRRRLLGGYRRPESIDEILLALRYMSETRTGALIVIERDIGLRTFIESGVRLDSHVSRDLLLSIFQDGNPLHDGAVIIQKERLAAAACFLPLSVNPQIATSMGTRHRAGIGITEETDCLSIMVSEETGTISVAAFGLLDRGLTPEQVDDRIYQHFDVLRKTTVAYTPGARPARPSPPLGSVLGSPREARSDTSTQTGDEPRAAGNGNGPRDEAARGLAVIQGIRRE